jgi:hypothetical protein
MKPITHSDIQAVSFAGCRNGDRINIGTISTGIGNGVWGADELQEISGSDLRGPCGWRALAPLMRAMRDRYFKQTFDSMTAHERASDPVLRRMRGERF